MIFKYIKLGVDEKNNPVPGHMEIYPQTMIELHLLIALVDFLSEDGQKHTIE